MGGSLRFTPLHRYTDDGLQRGARIDDPDALRDHVDERLSTSLEISTKTRSDEYPQYEYLLGLYYGHDDEPIAGDPFFIDNVYPSDYGDVFAGISEHTEPFAVLAAPSFPRLDELMKDITRTPRVIHAADGEARVAELELPDLPGFEDAALDLRDG